MEVRSQAFSALLLLSLLPAALLGCRGRTQGEPPASVDTLYTNLVTLLDATYQQLGRPAVSFETMTQVQRQAFEQFEAKSITCPPNSASASISLSSLESGVAIFINCDGIEKEGNWTP